MFIFQTIKKSAGDLDNINERRKGTQYYWIASCRETGTVSYFHAPARGSCLIRKTTRSFRLSHT